MTDFVFTTGDVGEMDSTSTANRFFFVTLSEVNYRNVFLHYTNLDFSSLAGTASSR